ncbi:MAG: InlB B-repeat-containing protein [Lachnospiraceae bacterium]|nr:InlB B-repeat-containing protein [Lachnospiraceae bacterium]
MKRRILAIILAMSMVGGNLNTVYAAAPVRMQTETEAADPFETDGSEPDETEAGPADAVEPEEILPEVTDGTETLEVTGTEADEVTGTGAEDVTADPDEAAGSVTYDGSVITAITPPDPSEIETEYKLALESLQNRMPEILPVSLGGTVVCDTDENGDPVAVSVTDAREAAIRVTDWECVQDYDEYLGEYEFTPVFAGTHTLAEGVKLPVIKVIVEKEEDGPTGYIEIPDNIEVPVVGDEILSGGLTVTPGEQPGIDGSFEAEILSTSSQAYYNGYAAGALPAIRDQGEEGACWSFASIGAVEADLIADEAADKDDIDLSELQLAYFTSHPFDDPKDCHDGDKVTYVGSGRYLDLGGNSTIAYRALSNKVGAVKEQYAPYRRGNISLEDEYATEMDFAQIKGAYKINVTDHSGIQAAIKAHGGVAASFYATEGTGELISKDGNGNIVSRTPYEVRYSATHNSFYGTLEKTNHAVMLVGWDDNFSKENFYDGCKPSQNGAWLVRNSWGMEEYGKSGYFWLSYYDAGLLSSGNVVAYDADTKVYDHVYTYDTQPLSTTSYSSSGKITVSQNYTVASGEKISAVGFETETANLSVTVKVTAGASSVTATKTTGFAGYYTVEFTEGLTLSSKTSVTVEITMEGTGTISVPTETVTSLYYGKNNDVYYQGVCSSGGCTINGEKKTNDARMRLFTNNATATTPDKVIKLKKTSINDHYNTQVQMELTDDSTVTMSDLTWSSVDEEIATVTAGGKITVGACKGSTVVVGRHANGQTVECQVTVKPYKITWHLDSGVKVYNQLREFYPGEKDNHYWHLGYQRLYRQGYEQNGFYSAAACSYYDWVDYTALNNTFSDIDLYVGWDKIALPIRYYAPNADLSGYDESLVYTVKQITIDDMPYTLPAADGAEDNPEELEFVREYNQSHPTTPKMLDGWSWDAAGTKKVTKITADTGFAMHADEDQGYGYLQNSSIVLYPRYKSGTSVVTGSCGTSVTYKLSGAAESGYTLALTGTGDMYDEEYSAPANLPWHAYRADITAVTVGEGITGLADYSFSNCEKLQTVSLPTTLKTIGERTFAGCGALTALTLPSGLTSIDKYALSNCSGLTAITFPASLTTIGSFVLSGCTGLTQIINQSNTTIENLPGLTGAHWINTASGSRAKITSLGKATATRVSEYSLVFRVNGGAGSMSNQYCAIGTTYLVPLCSFSRTGYNFTGWNTEANGSGEDHPVGTTILDLGEDEEEVYLYAQWRARSYTVSFDANAQGATVSPSSKSVTYDGTYGDLPVPVLSGYTSDGWFTSPTGGSQILATTTVATAANHTLYAHWRGDTHTVTFNANGGSGGTTKSYTNGSTYGTLPTAFKTGYDFDGWYTAEEGGTKIESTATVLLLADVTYYAHWTAKTYTVTFNPNGTGATVSPTSKTVTYDKPYGDLPVPQLAGCDFAGWYTGASTGTEVTATTTCKLTADQTLYARWTGKAYTVTLDTGTAEVTATPATITVHYGEAYPALPELSGRTGYTFDAWYTEETGGTRIYSTTLVTQAQDHTIYAHWNPISYKVNFDVNGGDSVSPLYRMVAYDRAYGAEYALPVPTWNAHGFVGWYTDAEGGTPVTNTTICRTAAEHTLYAHWTAGSYTVSFDTDGGTAVDPILVTNGQAYGTLPVTTKTGYTFDGWFSTKYGSTRVTETTVVTATGAHTLYAHWTANTYTIRYDANGGTGTAMAGTSATYDVEASLRANSYTKTGYTFTGWNTAADGSGDAYTDRQGVTNLTAEAGGIVTLYAQWVINTYTISYDANEGTGSMADTPATYDVNVTLRANTFTRTGYIFNGWNTLPNGRGTAYADGAVVKNLTAEGNATVTLYAQWTAITYTIRLDANGGTGTMADVTVRYDESKNLPRNTYTKAGHSFAGWNTEADGSGTDYADQARVSNLANVSGAIVILYAKWNPYSYTIRYDANGGEGTMADTAATCGANVTLTANTYTKTGYRFTGWNTAANGSGTAYADEAVVKDLATTSGAVVKLYAQWAANTYTIRYDANGGDGTMDDTAAVYGESKALRSNTFTKTGYHFDGWNTEADGSGTRYANGASVDSLTAEQGGIVTLYAQWWYNSYVISYNKNGGSGSMGTNDGHYGEEATLLLNRFRRTGYHFTGWNTKADGTGTSYADGATVLNLTAEDNGEVTLYAQWAVNTYTVRYDANGGEGTMADTAATYGENVTLRENTFTKDSYRFNGWNTAADGSGRTYADKASVSNLTADHGAIVTLYAQWLSKEQYVGEIRISATGVKKDYEGEEYIEWTAAVSASANPDLRGITTITVTAGEGTKMYGNPQYGTLFVQDNTQTTGDASWTFTVRDDLSTKLTNIPALTFLTRPDDASLWNTKGYMTCSVAVDIDGVTASLDDVMLVHRTVPSLTFATVDDNDAALGGVGLKLTAPDGAFFAGPVSGVTYNTEHTTASWTGDATGAMTFAGILVPGVTYALHETATPAGYEGNKGDRGTVTVTAVNEDGSLTVECSDPDVTYDAETKTVRIGNTFSVTGTSIIARVMGTGAGLSDQPLSGAVFDLYEQTGASPVPVSDTKLDTVTSDEGGLLIADFEPDAAKNYYLRQKTASAGHTSDRVNGGLINYTFTANAAGIVLNRGTEWNTAAGGSAADAKIVNQRIPGKFTIARPDLAEDNSLSDMDVITYRIYEDADCSVAVANGTISFTRAAGQGASDPAIIPLAWWAQDGDKEYYLRETTEIRGYYTDPTIHGPYRFYPAMTNGVDALSSCPYTVTTADMSIAPTLSIPEDQRPVAQRVRILSAATEQQVQTIDLDASVDTLKTYALRAVVEGMFRDEFSTAFIDQNVTWSSLNSNVAEVSADGVVTAKSNGSTTITASSTVNTNLKATVKVNVRTAVRQIVITEAGHTLARGKKLTLKATVAPADASTKTITWSSDDTDILTVTSGGIVTAVAQGTAYVTAAAADGMGAESEPYLIEVTAAPADLVTIKIGNDDMTGKTVGLDPDEDTLNTLILTAECKAKDQSGNYVTTGVGQEVIWKSTNPKIATVNEQGHVQAIAAGTVQITATAADGSNKSAKITINAADLVKAIEIKGADEVGAGKSVTLTADITPDSAKNKALVWTATADYSGVTGFNPATLPKNAVAITATGRLTVSNKVPAGAIIDVKAASKDGSLSESDEYPVTVKKPAESVAIFSAGQEVTNGTVGLDLDDSNTLQLSSEVRIKNGNEWETDEVSQGVTWKSANLKVATVDENGLVHAFATGTSVITATATDGSGKSGKITLNVNRLIKQITLSGVASVGAGKNTQLTATITPDSATNKTLLWSIDPADAAKATVANGRVTIKAGASGTVRVTATAKDGSVDADGKPVKGTFDLEIITAVDKVTILKDGQPAGKSIEQDLSTGPEIELAAECAGKKPGDEVLQTVSWKSSNTKIATVDDGTVTLLAPGTATITATAADGSSKSASVSIKVTQSAITISGPEEVAAGKSAKLTAQGPAVNWSIMSTEPAVTDARDVTVSAAGMVAVKNTVAAGTVITVKATSKTDSNKYETCTVTVKNASAVVKLRKNTDGVTVDRNGQTIGVDRDELENITLVATVTDAPGNAANISQKVTWKTSNAKVAEVDDNGVVKPLSAGTAKITATTADGMNKSASVTINVASLMTGITIAAAGDATQVAQGKALQFNATTAPFRTANRNVTWSTGEPDYTGVTDPEFDPDTYELPKNAIAISVTGRLSVSVKVPVGTSIPVFASSKDGSEIYSNTCTITVTKPAGRVDLFRNADAVYAANVMTGKKLGMERDEMGSTIALKAFIGGAAAFDADGSDGVSQEVIWSTTNAKVATVDRNGVVTSLAAGTAQIKATTADGSNKSATVTINVASLVTSLEISGPDTVTIGTKTSVTAKYTVTAVRPDRAADKKVTWTIDGITQPAGQEVTLQASDVRMANGTLTVSKKVPAGTQISIIATAADGGGAQDSLTVTVE